MTMIEATEMTGRDAERPDEDQELADEAGQARQSPGRCQDVRSRRTVAQIGMVAARAAHLGDRSVVGPLVDHADHEEEAARSSLCSGPALQGAMRCR